MSEQVWKQLSTVVGALLFSLLAALLVRPWFYALAGSLGDHWHRGTLLLWLLFVVATGIRVGSIWRQKLPWLPRLAAVASFFAIHSLTLVVFGFNLWLHVPLLLVLAVIGLRYWLYFSVAEFPVDFAWSALLVLLTLLLQNRIAITMTVLDVVVFFGSGFSLILLFHILDMEREGFKPPYPLLFVVMSLFVLLVLVVGALGGIPMGVELTQNILAMLRLAWAGFSRLLILMLYPLVMLFGPIFEWLAGLIPEGEPRQEEESVLMQNGWLEELEGTASSATTWSVPDWVYWVFGVLILVAVLVLVLRKLDVPPTDDTEGVEEERVSVFSTESLRRDAAALLGAWKRNWQRLRRSPGATTDPILRVRWAYKQFLHRMRLLQPREPHVTPAAYGERIGGDESSGEALQTLTAHYEKARYGLQAKAHDAAEAEQALEQLKRLGKDGQVRRRIE